MRSVFPFAKDSTLAPRPGLAHTHSSSLFTPAGVGRREVLDSLVSLVVASAGGENTVSAIRCLLIASCLLDACAISQLCFRIPALFRFIATPTTVCLSVWSVAIATAVNDFFRFVVARPRSAAWCNRCSKQLIPGNCDVRALLAIVLASRSADQTTAVQ